MEWIVSTIDMKESIGSPIFICQKRRGPPFVSLSEKAFELFNKRVNSKNRLEVNVN